MFRSAELFGYDIRNDTVDKQDDFSFSFFEPPKTSNSNNSSINTSSTSSTNNDTNKSKSDVTSKLTSTSNKKKDKDNKENKRPDINLKHFHLKLKSIPNALEIFKKASNFSCTKTHEVLVDEWRNNKEKMVFDYKKKRKDVS